MNPLVLCELDEIIDGGAMELLDHPYPVPEALVIVRRGQKAWAYINRCPHFSVPLNYQPQIFCTYRSAILMCAHHSAMFRFEDGLCVDGPCKGARLQSVPVRVERDLVLLAGSDQV
ncbi:Rieske (2Fe-2S) protein [Pseudomonas sp. NPDC087358]|uniref:Rieske (2Fe-2S) protein n=1 Tax=Pseudomonas sp. NPDC087358 TaxID=3364439 RepID=UPI00384BE80C